MSKRFKQLLSLVLATVMMLGMILPNLPTVTDAADGDETYASRWPMTGAEYTAYTSREAAERALNQLIEAEKKDVTIIASREGIAYDTSGKEAVFHITKDGTKYLSETLELDVNMYYVIETKIPKGWNLDQTIYEMNVVPGGQAVTFDDGYVYSKELPDFFKYYPSKGIIMNLQVGIDTKEEYMTKYPIVGAEYALFLNRSDAEYVQKQIWVLSGSTNYDRILNYKNVAADVDGNKLIFEVIDNDGNMRLQGTNQTYAWLDEDYTYYMVEIKRPIGYYFDSSIYEISSKGNEDAFAHSDEQQATTWIRLNKAWLTDEWIQDANPGEYNLGITWAIYKADKTTLVASGKTNPETGEMIWDTNYPYDGKPAIEVPLGIYYAREEAVDLNSGKTINRSWHTLDASRDEAINNCISTTIKNAPYDPHFSWTLKKTLSTADEQYYDLTLQGTQFTIYYFLDDELTENDLFEYVSAGDTGEVRKVLKDSAKELAERHWVLEAKDPESNDYITLADGTIGIQKTTKIEFEERFKVDGDDFYYNDFGLPVVLIGTYVFEETYATEGFSACDSWMWNNLNNVTKTDQDFSDYVQIPDEFTVAANRRQTIQIEIQKASNNSDKQNYYGTLAGAQFKLEFWDEVAGKWVNASATDLNIDTEAEYILTTDSNGIATSLPMKPGKYRLTEIKAPEGHTLNKGLSGVDNNGIIEFEIEVDVLNNGQRNFLFKYDSTYTDALINPTTVNFLNKVSYDENGVLKPLVGATVQVWELDANGNQVKQLIINGVTDFVTNGDPIELYGLSVGKTYRFIEVKQPEGYLMPQGHEAYVDFTVADDNSVYEFELVNEKIPQLKSKALFDTGIKEATADDNVKLVDHFWASDLLPNKTYTFSNIKLHAEDGSVVATANEVTFTTDSVTAEFDAIFNFHSALLKAGKYTVTGELHRNDRPVTTKVQTMEDLNDWDETIVKVEIGTFASDKTKSSEHVHFMMNDVAGTVVDRVDYVSAIGGTKYDVIAKLVDEQGNVVSEVKTNYTIPSTEKTVSGSFNVEIPVDATKWNGHTLTVFEYIYHDGTLIAKHDSLIDADQHVYIPEVKTVASETVVTNENDKENYWFELTDTVYYNHLPSNTAMVATLTVMDKTTGKALVDENGNTYTTTYDFTTDLSGEGSFDITIKIPYSLVEGKTFSVFEGIKTKSGLDIAHHYEWDDNDQTVHFPKIRTEGWFVNTVGDNEIRSKHVLSGTDTIKVLDEVKIWNTEVGETYTVTGSIELVDANGNVSTLATSNPTQHTVVSGEEDYFVMAVEFNNVVTAEFTKLDEGAILVITENIYYNNRLIGRHYQLTDAKQTLRSPDYYTDATDRSDSDKYIFNDGTQYVIDHFTYTDVTPGVKQKVVTYLVDQFGNEILDPNGKRYEVITEFTPDSTRGEFDILIAFDAKYLEGQIITVFEDIYEGDVLIGVHHDLSQERQTVYVPYVRTHGSYTTVVENTVEIHDVIEFKNLPTNETLYGKITLMDLDTKAPVKYNGQELSREFVFTTEYADGSYEVVVSFDVDALRYKNFVIFEELDRHVTIKTVGDNGELTEEEVILDLAEHKDWTDEAQTINMPYIETEAVDEVTNTHDGIANSAYITVVDHVYGYNLKPNHAYTLIAKLIDVNASTIDNIVYIDIDPVEFTFITPENVGDVYEVLVPIKVLAPLVVDKTVVVFESLIDGGVELAFHNDLYDEAQSVTYVPPTVETEASDNYTEEHTGIRNDTEIVLVDDVTMTGLLPDHTYLLRAHVINKTLSTEDNIVYVPVSKDVTFTTPENLKLTDEYVVTVTVRIPIGEVETGTKLVATETLYDDGIQLAIHADIDDEDQTVEYVDPEISTTATDSATGEHEGYRNSEILTIYDDVRMTGLLANKEYTLTAKVIDKANSTEDEIVYLDGIVVVHKFTTPEDLKITDEYVVTVTIDVPATMIIVGDEYVIAESLSVNDFELVSHIDVNDEDQTVHYVEPTIDTTATDEDTGDHTGYRNDYEIVIKDLVTMTGLLPNHTYRLDAKLLNKTLSTEDELVYVDCVVEGIEFTTPEDLKVTDEYSVIVTFIIPVGTIETGTKVVAAETLYDNDIELVAHVDIDDDDQSVEYEDPAIYTDAELASTEDNLKNDEVKVIDTVYYSNLKVGRLYTLRATAVNKLTGELICDAEGNVYEFIVEFTPETADGTVRVPMVFKQSDINGLTIVAFEKLFVEYGTDLETEIASHEDIEDENQTVKLPFEARITVEKKAAGTGYKLKGAEISIVDKDGNIVKDKYGNDAVGITDENGEVVFELYVEDDVQYFAKETQAPAGYQLNENLFELTKDENGVYTASVEIEILDEIIIIPPPQTGDNSNLGLWIGLLAASLAGIVVTIILSTRKKKIDDEVKED